MTSGRVHRYKKTLTCTLTRNSQGVLNAQKPFLPQEVLVPQAIISWDFSQSNFHCIIPLILSLFPKHLFETIVQDKSVTYYSLSSQMSFGLFSYTKCKIGFKTTNTGTDAYVMAWFSSLPKTYLFCRSREIPSKSRLFSVSGLSFLRRS